jgi:hypothetical protein
LLNESHGSGGYREDDVAIREKIKVPSDFVVVRTLVVS